MSSLILANDLHLIMLEIAVKNLFVPWTSDFDKVILKKTTVMFRMLDEDWTSLSPNRHDCLPYRGSNYENEKFYGGRSVVSCVPFDFFEKEAKGVEIQLYVQKETCKYFEINQCQDIGFTFVPVDNLLNDICRQIRERNELEEFLSEFYKRQTISRSMTGTYTLQNENFEDTAATISLYIRISCLGKSVITEITSVEGMCGLFRVRAEPDEEHPYLTRKLMAKDLQKGNCGGDLPPIRHDRLICCCKELAAKKTDDFPPIKKLLKVAEDIAEMKKKPPKKIIKKPKVASMKDTIRLKEVVAAIRTGELLELPPEEAARFRELSLIDEVHTAFGLEYDLTADELRERAEAEAADKEAREKAAKEAKEQAMRERAARKAKSHLGRSTVTVGIVDRRKRICRPPSFPLSCQQRLYSLYCGLLPHPTYSTLRSCFSIASCDFNYRYMYM